METFEPRGDLTAEQVAAYSPLGLAHIVSEGRLKPFAHLRMVNDYLLRLAGGEFNRLIIELPVRHGKSELVSHYFPVWWLGQHPQQQVMMLSYGDNQARIFGKRARDTLTEIGPRIFGVAVSPLTTAAEYWQLHDHVGVMTTAGTGGTITGRGADIMIIDDPIKDGVAANSLLERDNLWDWWLTTASTRLQPGGKVVLVMARWHEDDFAARIKANQTEMEPWTVLRLPAMAEPNDPMGRKPGEALCPELYPLEVLQREKAKSSYAFAALWQQAPAPPEGRIFKRSDFRRWRLVDGTEEAPVYELLDEDEKGRYISASECVIFQTVDIAASDKTTADWTVVSTWAATPQKDLVLLDSERQHFDTLHIEAFLKRKSDEHGRPRMWIETFGAGRTPYKQMLRSGYPVSELTAAEGTRNNKIARAQTAIALYENHKIFHPEGREFVGDFEDELAAFPAGHDDQVDTASYAAMLLPAMSVSHSVRQPLSKTIVGHGISGGF